MRAIILTVLALLVSGTSVPAAARQAGQEISSRPAVTVTRDGDVWTADYQLDLDAPVWGFSVSSLIQGSRKPWRLEQWRVVTPGVLLERVGTRDILRAANGGPIPRRVQIAFTPRSENLEADYRVLAFTDGSVALPSGQFDVFPLTSVAAAEAVPDDLSDYPLESEPATVTWRDRAGPVLFRGERVAEAVAANADTYVLFGQAQMTGTDRLVTVIDPQAPRWIGEAIEDFAPRAADYYASRLGDGLGSRPMVMVSWAGPTPGKTSMGGSVMPGLIVARFEGSGVLEPTARILAAGRWFIGHEAAHFWLGQVVRYERADDAWITEGGADLMAVGALKAIDPDYAALAELQKEVDDCINLADESVVGAAGRGEHRANYACGAVFAMVAEGAQRRATGGDWFDFLKPLIDASREDGVLTREEWLAELTRVSGDASLRADMETLLDSGAADPASVIAGLFDRAGVGYRRDEGKIQLD